MGGAPGFTADTPLVDQVLPSPNFGDRVGGPADAIVLHYTGMPTADGAIARLRDATAEVSAHYVVLRDGRIVQLVAESRRAWHAGRAFWRGERDLNSRSIGIEIVNGGHDGGLPPYPSRQVDAVIALCADVKKRLGVSPARVFAHSDIAPDRKDDPGERFPWRRLADAGVCLWAPPAPIRSSKALSSGELARAQRLLAELGFDVRTTGVADAATTAALAAFQRRHRPRRVDGVLDRSTQVTLDRVHALWRAAPPVWAPAPEIPPSVK